MLVISFGSGDEANGNNNNASINYEVSYADDIDDNDIEDDDDDDICWGKVNDDDGETDEDGDDEFELTQFFIQQVVPDCSDLEADIFSQRKFFLPYWSYGKIPPTTAEHTKTQFTPESWLS